MPIRRRVVGALARAEEALDRLKLSYKERFDRFAPAQVVPYRGYGRPDLVRVTGRVLEANETGFEPEPGVWTNIRNTVRRLETDEIRGATVRARFRGQETEVQADDEAFFEVVFRPDPPVEPGWHQIELDVVESMAEEVIGPVTAEVVVPPDDADFIVVSDMDDTVVRTGASERMRMLRTVFLNDSRTRVPFEGVAELYRALVAGPSGDNDNPVLYLSRSAWNLYPMLVGFLEHHGLPRGPLLLKDHGLKSVLGAGEDTFKADALAEILDLWPDLPLLLIGDSGQGDPEIYRDCVLENPGRVRAVIIRDVTSPERDREVHAVAGEIRKAGVPVILATNSAEAAKEAADLGLIHPRRVERVEAERSSEESASDTVGDVLG